MTRGPSGVWDKLLRRKPTKEPAVDKTSDIEVQRIQEDTRTLLDLQEQMAEAREIRERRVMSNGDHEEAA